MAGFPSLAAWRQHYASWGAAQGLGEKIAAFVSGGSRFLAACGLSASFAAALVVVIPILLVIGIIVVRGIGAISWEFLTAMPRDGMKAGGIFPAIVGTLLLTLGTALGNQNARQISAFMKLSVDGRELHTIAAELEKDPLIERVEVIGRQESLQRFRDSSGMEDLLDLLPTNPLPAVLIIHPRETVDEMDSLERLAMKIEARTTVEQVVLDREWMGTLFSTVAAFKRFSLLMTLLFALLVGLVIHNGLRIDVLEHRHEIEVIKLVGGSDHYIQRPFHYHAVIVGAAGGLLAALFIALLFAILQPRFDELGAAYGVELPLRVGAGFALTLVLLATILSLLSSRITLGALLKRIQP